MKLKNDFKQEDKIRYWVDHPYCAVCGYNQGCALHHIDGRVSSSIFNGIMLCSTCHLEADTHNTDSPLSQKYRAKLRNITHKHLLDQDVIINKNDEEYLSRFYAQKDQIRHEKRR